MLKKFNKSNQGFTIVEVVIVLAIAGLIMLIVFLAVPALQRSQRNTGRKNDAGRIGAVATEWVSNHGGAVPTQQNDIVNFRTAVGTLNQYTAAQLTIAAGGAGPINATNSIVLATNAKCGAGNQSNQAVGANNARQMAVVWGIETGGNAQGVCQNV